jgi:hypothetical protein
VVVSFGEFVTTTDLAASVVRAGQAAPQLRAKSRENLDPGLE